MMLPFGEQINLTPFLRTELKDGRYRSGRIAQWVRTVALKLTTKFNSQKEKLKLSSDLTRIPWCASALLLVQIKLNII